MPRKQALGLSKFRLHNVPSISRKRTVTASASKTRRKFPINGEPLVPVKPCTPPPIPLANIQLPLHVVAGNRSLLPDCRKTIVNLL